MIAKVNEKPTGLFWENVTQIKEQRRAVVLTYFPRRGKKKKNFRALCNKPVEYAPMITGNLSTKLKPNIT